ncbi:MAG TPA: single-stranded DNA-binding protein [Flavobacteriaceae bacterium]|nr:single-stranded DNA-binding protein [Flavobacteriaceae bacterium]MAM29723.1 single-stranded DNA-binding protein [Flavobacteriaceae bacterium]MAY52608.1 single-stranded DNA-binding protein [Flavobacteriaceae bacterium]HBR53052.1 single-stranded DNA-binding protein [Flavobacteriaceae bacterium]|tara:strand:+ start:1334 stop:1804 length:471 start_codon:yes stop_codon:yes gene_type:complete
MSGTLNKVMLIGHTGDEVKMHYFDGGGSIGRFPLATNETYTNRTTGERVTNTEWHNIVVRNKGAEICEKYLKKGDKVYIEGRLKTRKWQDEQGKDRYSTEIQCTDFTFLTPKTDGSGAPSSGNDQQSSAKQQPSQTPAQQQHVQQPHGDEDDDLPF